MRWDVDQITSSWQLLTGGVDDLMSKLVKMVNSQMKSLKYTKFLQAHHKAKTKVCTNHLEMMHPNTGDVLK